MAGIYGRFHDPRVQLVMHFLTYKSTDMVLISDINNSPISVHHQPLRLAQTIPS
jgi:hypothetical protein